VQQGTKFEKRNVKVGISDFFYAEIQEGLAAGDTVALELPKEERDRKARELAESAKGGPPAKAPKLAAGSTNAPKAGTTATEPVAPKVPGTTNTSTTTHTTTSGQSQAPSAARVASTQ
jgi:hypothetical protein